MNKLDTSQTARSKKPYSEQCSASEHAKVQHTPQNSNRNHQNHRNRNHHHCFNRRLNDKEYYS